MSIAQNLSSSTFPSHYIDNIDSDQQDINGTTAAISREVPKNETNSKLESLGTTQISPSKNVSHIGEVVTSLPNYTNETTSTTKSTTTATDFQFDQETTNFFNRSGTISSTKSTKSFPPHTPQTTTTIMPSTHSTTTTSSPNKAKTTTTTVKPDTDDVIKKMYVHLFIFIFSAIGKISIADENTSCLEMIENEFNFGEDFSENIQNLILVNLNDDLSCQSFIEYLSLKLRESTHSYWKELDEQGRRRIASHLLPLLKYQILNGTNGPVKSIIEAIGFENIFGPREINCSQQIKQTFDLSHSLSENLIDHLNLSNHKECRQFIKISKNYLFDRVQLINSIVFTIGLFYSIRSLEYLKITLQDISDDDGVEFSSTDDVDDNEDLFAKVTPENGEEANIALENKPDVRSIQNDTEPVFTGENKAVINEYEYDSSDEEDVLNTIGNIPYEWYKDYVHIGYDVDGRKIIKPKNDDQVQEFLNQIDDPNYWRTVKDNLAGQKVVLSDQDVNLVKRIRNAKCPDPTYNQYESFIDFFTYEKMIHPVTNRPEPKAAFIPSLSEKRLVSKLVSAIKKARLKPKPVIKKPKPFEFNYDLWEKDGEKNPRLDRYIPAPKPKPPGHEESYNPPPEYLFTDEEEKEWLEQDPEDRKINFIPRSYSSLRKVPAYPDFIKERFERSLDLYLCPRVRKNRIRVNPEDLIPELPKPSDLQPFPSIQSMVYSGHEANIVCITVEQSSQYMASGDKDGVVKIWEILTGRCFKTLKFSGPISNLSWSPNDSKSIVAIVVENMVYIINIGLGQRQIVQQTEQYFENLNPENNDDDGPSGEEESNIPKRKENPVCHWKRIHQENDAEDWLKGIRLIIKHDFEIKQLAWHAAGEYISTVMPHASNRSIVIHHLSRMKSQVPFKKIKDIIQYVKFHPTKAYFFVATKRTIRIYDLIKQQMTKKLSANCNEISSMAIHPGGDNIIISSMDPRVQWFDLDLSDKPYKTMRYHKKAVRCVDFHRKYPLFASSSDDGTVVVCHGMVYNDLLQNALIVPVKVLKAQNVKKQTEIMQCLFHPNRPWLFAISSNTTKRIRDPSLVTLHMLLFSNSSMASSISSFEYPRMIQRSIASAIFTTRSSAIL
ncbi:Ribosome biogenesis protein 1 [Dermatophagoides farinae]|uniref:Ribosome biogenesis protein BOP1 homolog n=1 Tax=Dermatophagoides farinae TaxID=6954 RepID=A0A922IBF9_DERFA|nr:Ribosome biogenesis protein 1 [Dermatophagoides farinae]